MGPVAVGLFSPEFRGRVAGALSGAGSLALVIGVPAGTWLGQQNDWKNPLPTEPAPTPARSQRCLWPGVLSATGAFAGYTYIVKFSANVCGFSSKHCQRPVRGFRRRMSGRSGHHRGSARPLPAVRAD